MSTFLQGIGEQASTGSQFIAEFRQRWVGGWNAWHASNGYSIGDDGVARKTTTSMTTMGTLESRRLPAREAESPADRVRDGELRLRAANNNEWRRAA